MTVTGLREALEALEAQGHGALPVGWCDALYGIFQEVSELALCGGGKSEIAPAAFWTEVGVVEMKP